MRMQTRLIVIGIIGTAVAVTLLGVWHWGVYHPEDDDFYTDFKVPVIPGAKPIHKEQFGFSFLPKGNVVWVYSIPHEYATKLYADCAAIHFETGINGQPGQSDSFITPYLVPKSPGCYKEVSIGKHGSVAVAQFSGDRLITDYWFL